MTPESCLTLLEILLVPLQNPLTTSPTLIIILLLLPPLPPRPRPIFSNRNLNPLRGKAFTECRALDNAGELFCAEDLEDVGEGGGEDRGGAIIEILGRGGGADVNEVHFEAVRGEEVSGE